MWPMLQDSPMLSFSGTGTTCLSLVSSLHNLNNLTMLFTKESMYV